MIRIVEHSMAVKTVETRVRGGYMNRWLIRDFVEQPCAFHDRIHDVMYVHPSLMPKLRALSDIEAPLGCTSAHWLRA